MMKNVLITLLLFLQLGMLNAQEFTLGTIPDTQNMTEAGEHFWKVSEMTQYYVDNKAALNLKFVASLGDMTQWGADYQWPVVKNAYNLLKNGNVPYAPCQGNHDWNINHFNTWFPVSDFTNNPNSCYGGSMNNNIANAYYLFSASGMDFIVVVIQSHDQFLVADNGYDMPSVNWTNNVLTQYSDRRAILITHDFYEHKGLINDVIKKHDNLFLAVCGHSCARELYWTETSPSGNIVNCIMTDYQCDADKGATNRFYTFKPSENKICAYTYNVVSDRYETDANSQFCFDYDMAGNGPKINLTQAAAINEGAENGKQITVTLTNGTWADPLNASNWTLGNLPAGVTKGSISRISNTEATITLNGNSTIGTYATDITNVSVTIDKSEITGAANTVSKSNGITLSKSPYLIPGIIQAEGYSDMSGVQLETTTDAGAGKNVGYIDSGDWMTYKVNVQTAGKYLVTYRVASTSTGKILKLESAGGATQFGSVNLPNTGGWQIWQPATHEVELSAGIQNIAIATSTGGFNVNWMEFVLNNSVLPSIVLSQSESIKEGEENGKTITVTLSNATYATVLNNANWTITNLPAGVSVGSITRVSDHVATVTLSGNSVLGTYTSDISNVSVSISSNEIQGATNSVSANSGVLLLKSNAVATGTKWNSYQVEMGSTSPQATVTADGISATLEFYESTNDGGVDQSTLFTTYTSGNHPDAFNNAKQVWNNSNYPYAAISNVGRGSDGGETSAPAPSGVNDLMLHPPINAHTTVCAFVVPKDGKYSLSNLAVRRVSASGATVHYTVLNQQKEHIAELTASNNQTWVTDNNTYDLTNLYEGDKIYFAVSNDGDFTYDATEIAWTITYTDLLTSTGETPEEKQITLFPNPAKDQVFIAFANNFIDQSKVELFDLKGRKIPVSHEILGNNVVSMEIKSLKPGIYTVKVENAYKKLIIE